MPARYVIIFIVVLLFAQLLIWAVSRGVAWYFRPWLRPRAEKVLKALFWLLPNGILLLTATRTVPLFRTSATLLFLLVYMAIITALCAVLYKLFSVKYQSAVSASIRVLSPLALAGVIGLGLYNAYTPVVRHYAFHSDKLQGSLRVALIADLHLGKIFGNAQLDQLADILAAEKSDVVLIPGDLMDDNTDVFEAENMQPHLAKIRAPLGVYATLGNHDFKGQRAITRAVEGAGITVLTDTSTLVDERFYLIGRNDRLSKVRPATQTLLAQLPNDNKLRILLDHRPDEIEENATLALDMQVSGHTHKGQVFPANLITKVLYTLDHGYLDLNSRHFFVTSGYGLWGIPFRIGSQSEVMIIDINP
ncbi:metallophosphoesterase [Pasteurellaceae bacterium HPA106]|uniref:metallophosphoesterase n=1 Tax=Spirabiliibacterium pneumoniae TaxID=221400 RepID=UPI001AACBA96|nr:metallophosphoesterase [Spirabiliibacterium pneumoniae]MBE2896721.1 metallophosphoesterase [Spirabiliibacterium pneumoniae]